MSEARPLTVSDIHTPAQERVLKWAQRILRGAGRWAMTKLSGTTVHVQEIFTDEELKVIIMVKVNDLAIPKSFCMQTTRINKSQFLEKA